MKYDSYYLLPLIKQIFRTHLLVRFAGTVMMIFTLTCADSDYPMDNWIDVPLQELEPPAVFFNPHEINVSVGDTFAVNLYVLQVDNVAGVHLRVQYLRQSLQFLDMEVGELFIDGFDTLFFWDSTEASYLDVYSFYLADESTYSSGTASIATAYFRAKNSLDSEIIYLRPATRMVTPDNQLITINSYGKATIKVD